MEKQEMEQIMETLKPMLANYQEQINANTKTMLAERQTPYYYYCCYVLFIDL
jgi:hypothetical protein